MVKPLTVYLLTQPIYQALAKRFYIDPHLEDNSKADRVHQDTMFGNRLKKELALAESRIMCELEMMEGKRKPKGE